MEPVVGTSPHVGFHLSIPRTSLRASGWIRLGRRRAPSGRQQPPPARRCRRTNRPRCAKDCADCGSDHWRRCRLKPEHKSSQAALPAIVPPPRRSGVTTVASMSGTKPSSNCEPFIIGTPATQMLSLTAMRFPLGTTRRIAGYLGLPIPCVIRVFVHVRAMARRPRHPNRQLRFRQFVQTSIGSRRPLHDKAKVCGVLFRPRSSLSRDAISRI